MTSNLRWTRIGVIAALLVMGLGPWALQAYFQDDPTSAIKKVLDRQEQDWNKGDLDAFLEGYWNSPKVVFQSGGDRNVGFEAMRERYRKRYKAEGRAMGRVSFSDVEIEPLGSESAFVRGRWGLTMPDGKKPGGLFTLIFRKFPTSGWKIVHDHTSIGEDPAIPPAPPAPSPGRPPG
jgi:ketosteroid isomerase-like protein